MTKAKPLITGTSGSGVVAKLLRFQRTGAGFDDLWTDLHPIVVEFAHRNLVKLGVRVRRGDTDEPVGEVVN